MQCVSLGWPETTCNDYDYSVCYRLLAGFPLYYSITSAVCESRSLHAVSSLGEKKNY